MSLLKVVILGDGGVGKSCLMHRFVSSHFDEHSLHTIGVEFLNRDLIVDGRRYTLQIWDTAGQERFRSLRTPFYRGTDVCLLTYAVDDRASFDNLRTWMDEFVAHADVPDAAAFPFLVVGNKSDRPRHQVSREQVAEWCDTHRVGAYVLTSAKTEHNVQRAFALAVQKWIELEKAAESRSGPLPTDSVRLPPAAGGSRSLRADSNAPCCGAS